MKKIFTLLAVAICINTYAQDKLAGHKQPILYPIKMKQKEASTANVNKKSHNNTVYTSQCDTISNFLPNDTMGVLSLSTLYVDGSPYSIDTGYFSGSWVDYDYPDGVGSGPAYNYSVQAIGEIYNQPNSPINITQIQGVELLFYHDYDFNFGTKGTSILTLNITNTTTDMEGGVVPSTTIIATQTLSLSDVLADTNSSISNVDYAGNDTLYDYSRSIITYPVMFSSPVSIAGSFAITLSMPINGDTVAIWSNYGRNVGDRYTACNLYYMAEYGIAYWYNVHSLYGYSPTSFALAPIACYDSITMVASFNSPSSICQGISYSFIDASVYNPISWNWNVVPSMGVLISNSTIANPSITFSNTGTYTVSLIVSNGINIDTASSVITVNSLPNVSYTLTADATPHIWDAVPSISGGTTPYIYLWSWGDGSTTDTLYTSHTYTAASHYNVCLTAIDANGCSAQYCENDSLYRTNASIVQINVVSSTSGISQVNSQNSELKIYPNPTNTIINVELKIQNESEIKIYDVLGDAVIISHSTQIDVSSLSNGIYFIRVGNATQKFVKQ